MIWIRFPTLAKQEKKKKLSFVYFEWFFGPSWSVLRVYGHHGTSFYVKPFLDNALPSLHVNVKSSILSRIFFLWMCTVGSFALHREMHIVYRISLWFNIFSTKFFLFYNDWICQKNRYQERGESTYGLKKIMAGIEKRHGSSKLHKKKKKRSLNPLGAILILLRHI